MAKRKNGLSFYRKKKKFNYKVVKEVVSWLIGAVIMVFIGVVGNYLFGYRTEVVSVSMEPTLYSGDRILVDKFIYLLSSPKKGDIIVFLPNGNENSHYYIKRVVAKPGETVLIKDGYLYVNDVKSEDVKGFILDEGIAQSPLTLSATEYFVIGDNADNSEDSRSANIGPVDEKDILGKAWFTLKSAKHDAGFIR